MLRSEAKKGTGRKHFSECRPDRGQRPKCLSSAAGKSELMIKSCWFPWHAKASIDSSSSTSFLLYFPFISCAGPTASGMTHPRLRLE